MTNRKEYFDRILMDGISDMVFVMKVIDNEEFIYEYINRAAIEGTDHNRDTIGKSMHDVISQQLADDLYEHYRNVAHNLTSVTYKDTYVSQQGEARFYDSTLTPLVDSNNICTHILAVVKDITQKVTVTRKLEESEEHFRIVTENADDLITLINNTGEIIYASPSYRNLLGVDPEEYIGKIFLHNVHVDDRLQLNKKVMQALKNGEHFNVEVRQYNHENKAIWFESHGAPVFDAHQKLKHMVVITRNISRHKEYEMKLKHFAHHDSLTGLPNRRLFKKKLIHALKQFKKKNNELAVIMLDIDDFKGINDEMGHDIGDAVIEEYGRRLSETIGENEIVARLGGDEFVILLPQIATVDNAIAVAKNIQIAIQQPWDIYGNRPKVTTSIGIAMASVDTTPFSILKNADIALYEAKNAGGNMYTIKD